MSGQVEERLGPDLEVGVPEERLRLREARTVSRLVEGGERAAPHFRVRVAEEAPHRGWVAAPCRPTAIRSSAYRISRGSSASSREEGRRLPVEHRRRGALGVQAVLPQPLAQRRHVPPVHPRREEEPRRDEGHRDEGEPGRPHPARGGEDHHREAGQAVAGQPSTPPCR